MVLNPGSSSHVYSNDDEYVVGEDEIPLPVEHVTTTTSDNSSFQDDWRRCNKCQGLFYGPGFATCACPAGERHASADESGSGNYRLPHKTPPDPTQQSDWRWCNKCQGLFYGPGFATSACPAGERHTSRGRKRELELQLASQCAAGSDPTIRLAVVQQVPGAVLWTGFRDLRLSDGCEACVGGRKRERELQPHTPAPGFGVAVMAT